LHTHKQELFGIGHVRDNNNNSKEKGSEEMTECCPDGSASNDPNSTAHLDSVHFLPVESKKASQPTQRKTTINKKDAAKDDKQKKKR
jgi:hypothetical protein